MLYLLGLFAVIGWAAFYIADAPAQDEGTRSEMKADPDLNTQDFKLHMKRLKKFGHSKFDGETEFMGPRGGIYTITASGNRNYR